MFFMHNRGRSALIITAGILLVLGIVIAARFNRQPPIRVAATVFPLYDVVRFIGGGAVDVELMLPGGETPERLPDIYRTTDWGRFRRVFAVGHSLDTTNLPVAADDLIFVPDKGVQLLLEQESTGSPYYWLSVRRMEIVADNIAAELKRLDPSHARLFEKRRVLMRSQLEALDTNITQLMGQLPRKTVFLYGYDWSYFLEDYGLTAVWTHQPADALSQDKQEDLAAAISKYGGTVIFSDISISSEPLLPFVFRSGIAIENLDAFGGTEGHASYLAAMGANATTIFANAQTAGIPAPAGAGAVR